MIDPASPSVHPLDARLREKMAEAIHGVFGGKWDNPRLAAHTRARRRAEADAALAALPMGRAHVWGRIVNTENERRDC